MKNQTPELSNESNSTFRKSKLSFSELAELYEMEESLFPIVKRARSGSIAAQYELYKSFMKGENVVQDFNSAAYYILLVMDTIYKKPKTEANVKLYISALLDFALVEEERNNYKSMDKACRDAVYYMQKYLPVSKWDFSIFDIIKESTQK